MVTDGSAKFSVSWYVPFATALEKLKLLPIRLVANSASSTVFATANVVVDFVPPVNPVSAAKKSPLAVAKLLPPASTRKPVGALVPRLLRYRGYAPVGPLPLTVLAPVFAS